MQIMEIACYTDVTICPAVKNKRTSLRHQEPANSVTRVLGPASNPIQLHDKHSFHHVSSPRSPPARFEDLSAARKLSTTSKLLAPATLVRGPEDSERCEAKDPQREPTR